MKLLRAAPVFAAIAFCAAAAMFLASPQPPFAFQKDLGVNITLAAYGAALFHHGGGIFSTWGWKPLQDSPSFFLSGYTSYALLVPIAILTGAWQAVKIVEVLQFGVAFFGVAFAASRMRRPTIAGAFAGMAYAAVPALALSIRWNTDLGWVWVLAPWAYAFGEALIARYGARALLAAGVLCAAAGPFFHIQYLLYTALPLYAIIAVDALRRERTVAAWGCALAGLASLGLSLAWFLFPTFVDPFFTDSGSRLAQLSNEQTLTTLLSQFSDGAASLTAFMQAEYLASPFPADNASGSMPLAVAGGALLWLAAALAAFVRRSGLLRREWPAIAAGAICVYLGLGPNVPFGDLVWQALDLVPRLNAFRTPDRFLTLPFMLACILLGRAIASAEKPRVAAAMAALTAAAAALFGIVDAQQHVLATSSQLAQLEPDLFAANAAAQMRGGRVVSLATVRNGSQLDFTLYGVPQATLEPAWGIAGRYVYDGTAGTGIFRRAGVRSVITSPGWTTENSAPPPDMTGVFGRIAGLPRVFGRSGAIAVYALPNASAPVTARRILCVRGGPGMLDRMLASSAASNFAFTPSNGCSGTAYFHYNPLDALASTARETVAGTAFPHAALLRDADYSFEGNREHLNLLWFRDSLDGDEVLFSPRGVALITSDSRTGIDVDGASSPVILLRLVAHAPAIARAAAAGGGTASARIAPRRGVQWIALRPRMPRHAVRVTIEIAPQTAAAPARFHWQGIALDGVAVADARAVERAAADGVQARTSLPASRRVEPPVEVRADGVERWRIRVPAAEDVELAESYDGSWAARSAAGTFEGEPCDVVNTCFAHLPPGVYEISHSMPVKVLAGTLVTTSVLFFAFLLVAVRRPFVKPAYTSKSCTLSAK